CGDNSDEENCPVVTQHPPPGIFSCEYCRRAPPAHTHTHTHAHTLVSPSCKSLQVPYCPFLLNGILHLFVHEAPPWRFTF
ncbi:unnamed protein product, partial [Tetraodon nigroviridis]